MKLYFHGGVEGLVTGANYLLDNGTIQMLVDCGLSQGSRFADLLNYEPFAYDPAQIGCVFITHSHVDHMGRLPKLYKDGFRGKIYATSATKDLIIAALPDTQQRMADDARRNQTEPLYTEEEVNGVTALIEGVEYDVPFTISGDTRIVFHDAGHVLGSSIIEIGFTRETGEAAQIFFCGDVGNPPAPLLRPTEFVHDADYVVIESAYGDRIHEDRSERKNKLISVIRETIQRGGTLMIPSFALERTQELLYELNEMINSKSIPEVPVFVDSPLAIKMTEVYEKYPNYFNQKSQYLIASGDDIFKFPMLRFTQSVEESKSINETPSPKIIIAGSGMSNGGRILHHELRYLPDPKSTILFIGYQVKGSLGRRIFDGEKQVTILGQQVSVNCSVHAIGGYSAHADQPALVHWVAEAAKGNKLKKVFVVQGETTAAQALAQKITEELSVETILPKAKEGFVL